MSHLAIPRQRRPVALGVSVSFHLVAAVALFALSSWQLDPLGRPRSSSAVTFWAPPEHAPAGGDEPGRLKGPRKGKKVVEARASSAPRAAAPTQSGGGEAGGESGGGREGTSGPGSGPGLGINPLGTCLSASCDEPPGIELPREPLASVPSDILEGHRIAGKTDIHPSNQTAIQMKRDGKTSVMATAKVCIDRRGSVRSVSLLGSSGYPEYDARLRSAMKRWRYRPYRVAGVAMPACTPVQFRYLVE